MSRPRFSCRRSSIWKEAIFELAAETFDRAAKLLKSIAQPKADILPQFF
jgi:hypothetical protein